jgi:hypothetical protein
VVDAMERDMATHLAAKSDLAAFRAGTQSDFAIPGQEMRSEFAAIRQEMKAGFAATERGLERAMKTLRTQRTSSSSSV